MIAPIKIFIKIHPSENPIPWKKLAEKHKNIEISEKSVEDLLSSDGIIIQSESTTGVQSEINNKRSFSYIPEEYKYSKIPLTIIKRVSNTVYDIDQFVNVIKENLITSNMSHKSDKYLVKYFNNLKQKNFSKLILTNLSKLNLDFLVKNFSLLSNYKIQELDKNLILIENK
ncbi:MAG: hypothetical protein VW580_04750 [Flavobacteriaceae bacterium]